VQVSEARWAQVLDLTNLLPDISVMKCLFDAEEYRPGLGLALQPVYFPDPMLTKTEKKRWKAYRTTYKENLEREKAEKGKAEKENAGYGVLSTFNRPFRLYRHC
jgi:hypothetical protein